MVVGRPEIFNSDQGSQFTSTGFTDRLVRGGIRISMDGRGRALDNVFIERLWRTVKYEEIYLHDYQQVAEARLGLGVGNPLVPAQLNAVPEPSALVTLVTYGGLLSTRRRVRDTRARTAG